MAEAHIMPVGYGMAVGARGGEVIARRAVALGAVGEAIVRNPYLIPGCGEMTTAAVTGVVAVRPDLAVAAVAVCLPGVIKSCILPGGFLVTAAALTWVVINWLIVRVAGLTVLIKRMVKSDV